MRKYVRLGAVGALMATAALMFFGSPAQAATNPYTPQEACNHQFGGSWSTTTDGHRSLTTLDTGAKWGDVYLMYNSATGYNCVATIKTAYVGTATYTDAALSIQGETNLWQHEDYGRYSYYAATEGYASNRCVQYQGWIDNPSISDDAAGARLSWGNCG